MPALLGFPWLNGKTELAQQILYRAALGGAKRTLLNNALARRSYPIPAPPRITIFPSNHDGLHANPSCGPKLFRSALVNCVTRSILASFNPSVPRTSRPNSPPSPALIGAKYSQRNPRFRVKLERNLQLS